MSSTTETRTAISPTPPAMLRLRLQPDEPAGLLTAIYADGHRSRAAALPAAGLEHS